MESLLGCGGGLIEEVPVKIDVSPVPLEEVLSLRELYRREINDRQLKQAA